MSPDASRDWGVAVLVACADVVAATFWPGPVNSMTALIIMLVDAVLLIALIAVPKVLAAWRSQKLLQADALAGAPILYWHPKPVARDLDPIDVANAAQVQL